MKEGITMLQHFRRAQFVWRNRPPEASPAALSQTNSSGRTRTCNPPVTSAPAFLPGLDYLITCSAPRRGKVSGAGEALLGRAPQPLVSARSCLRYGPSAGFAQGHRSETFGVGFLEFTRSFNHGFPWKLQFLQPAALPVELPRIIGWCCSKGLLGCKACRGTLGYSSGLAGKLSILRRFLTISREPLSEALCE
jgi:hypothetical protein